MFLECNSYITWCSTWTKLQIQEYVNTMCNIMQRSLKRCRQVLFEFWLWRGDSPLFKITGGLGGCPQTKLTISAAEILSIHRKWTSTCESRDSRKSSKKQNRWMVDLAFCLGRDCKIVALKHNDFIKHGASNLLLWVPIVSELFEHVLLGSFEDFFVVFFLFLCEVFLLSCAEFDATNFVECMPFFF